MKTHGLNTASIFVLSMMAGCVSAPTYDEYASTMQPVPSYDGRLYIYRVITTRHNTIIRPAVQLDGEPVGRAIPGGFFYLDLAAGDYEISLSTYTKTILALRLKVGEEKYVRLDMNFFSSSWDIEPILVSAEVAREELKNLEYTGEIDAAR